MHKQARGKWGKVLLWPEDVRHAKASEGSKILASRPEYVCGQCTFVGQDPDACSMCGSSIIQVKEEEGEVTPSSTWACRSCTFDNEAASETCVMCGIQQENGGNSEENGGEENEGEADNSPWNCEQCSFENEAGESVCAMCGGGEGL